MKKPKTKRKVTITLDEDVLTFLEDNFENKSRYVEYLIYKDMKDNDMIKKDIIL